MKAVCFITGASGFVGSNITRLFIEKGYDVHILLRRKTIPWRLKEIAHKVKIIQGDVCQPQISRLIQKIHPKYIFHLATYGAYPQEINVNRMLEVNVKGTINMIQAALLARPKLFINTSSSSEYGVKEQAMKETDMLVPINDYGVTKAAASLYSQKEAYQSGLAIITLRLFSVYGAYEEKRRLIPSLILGALKNLPIPLSRSEHVRDFLYSEDVASAFLAATTAIHEPGAIYNIGSAKQNSVGSVAKLIIALTKSSSRLDWGLIKKQERQMEPAHWFANRTKAFRVFGWEPQYNLRSGLARAIIWFKEHSEYYE